MSPCLNLHLNTLQDSKQGILGHNPGWSVPFHTQVEIQGTGWLTGSCLGQLILHGRQQSQGHCLLMNHLTSPLFLSSLSSGPWQMEMAWDPEQLAWLGMLSFLQDGGCGIWSLVWVTSGCSIPAWVCLLS